MGDQERNSISSDEPEEIFGDSSKNGTKPEKLPDDNEQQSSQIEYKKMSNKNNSNNSSKEIDTLDDSLRKSGFIIDSPSAMFENFYEMKKAALRRHIPDGNKLPINKWSQEMHDAYVDMRINLNDKDIIADKMQSIQQKRDRIVQIKSVINSQYFLWKRISPMLTGQLARVVYEKPAVKQDGVNYEHIRDVEEYYGELEGLFETSKDILNNLDAAYDNLSRQVTLTGILPLPKKYGSSDNQGHTKTMSIDNDGFDSLDDNSSVKPSSSIPKMSKKNIDGPQEVSF